MSIWNKLPHDRLLVDVSLWSAALGDLGSEVKRIETHADLLHVDVSDAHLTPGLLFFPDLLAAVKPLTSVPFHVHLMVEHPLSLIDDFILAGADMLTVHYEIGSDVAKALHHIHEHERAAGLAVTLDVPLEAVKPYLQQVDLIVLMGTALGIKGIDPAPEATGRIETLQRLLSERGLQQRVKIEADGGLRRHTVPALRSAGADLISPGSLIFGSPDLREVFGWLHSLPGPRVQAEKITRC